MDIMFLFNNFVDRLEKCSYNEFKIRIKNKVGRFNNFLINLAYTIPRQFRKNSKM